MTLVAVHRDGQHGEERGRPEKNVGVEHPLAEMEMPEGDYVFEAVAKPPARIYTIGHNASGHQFFKSICNKLGCVPTPFGIEQPEVGDMKRFEGPLKMGQPRATGGYLAGTTRTDGRSAGGADVAYSATDMAGQKHPLAKGPHRGSRIRAEEVTALGIAA